MRTGLIVLAGSLGGTRDSARRAIRSGPSDEALNESIDLQTLSYCSLDVSAGKISEKN